MTNEPSKKTILYINEMAEIGSVKKSQSSVRLIGSLIELGIKVDVLTSKHFQKPFAENSLMSARFVSTCFGKESLTGRFLNSLLFSLKTIWTVRKYDTVIFNQPNPISNLAVFFAKKDTKIILEIRDIWPDALQELRSGRRLLILFEQLVKAINNRLYKRADGIISALPYWEKEGVTTLYMPTLTSSASSAVKKKKANRKIKIVYFGGYKYQSNFASIVRLLMKSSASSILSDVEFHFFGGIHCKILTELKISDNRIVLHDIVEYEQFARISKDFDIGLLAFYNWDVYKYGLNSNRLSAYLENNVIPYAICDHSFEPEVDRIITKVKNGSVHEQIKALKGLVLSCKENGHAKDLQKLKFSRSQKRYSSELKKFLNDVSGM